MRIIELFNLMDEVKTKLLFYISPRLKRREVIRKKGMHPEFKDELEFVNVSFDNYPLSWRIVSPSRQVNKQNLKRIMERNLYCHSNFEPNIEGRRGQAFIEGFRKQADNEDNTKLKSIWAKSLINQSTPLVISNKKSSDKLFLTKYPTTNKINSHRQEDRFQKKQYSLITDQRYIKEAHYFTIVPALAKSLSKFKPKGASKSQLISLYKKIQIILQKSIL